MNEFNPVQRTKVKQRSRVGMRDDTAASREDGVPPGWDYNPSAWPRRLPIMCMVFMEAVIAIYLALYQYEFVPSLWEPFFAGKTHLVLRSEFSYVFSVPSAVLGAVIYIAAVALGIIGGEERWRRHPWTVLAFFLLIVPAALMGLFLIMAQSVWLNAWCTLCLLFGVLALALVGPALDEALACLQYLKRVRERPYGPLSGRR